MSKKLALTLVLIMLGLASWDAALDRADYTQETEEEGQVRTMEDGTPRPPIG